MKRELNGYNLSEVQIAQAVLNIIVGHGVTDLVRASLILGEYIHDKHREFRNERVRIESRHDRVQVRLNTSIVNKAERDLVERLPVCPRCGRYRLIVIANEDTIADEIVQVEICADVSKGSPKNGCGYSVLVK